MTEQLRLFKQEPPPPLFVYPVQLRKIYTHLMSDNGCYYKYNNLRKLFNKRKDQYITVKELADWEDIPVEEIILRIT